VSGLKLNVAKSAALNLVEEGAHETIEGRGHGDQDAASHDDNQEIVKVTGSTRYLGHIAGTTCTTEEAWSKAFAALRIRLVLAESKTNTVQQRASIAAAIVIPKMMYVARHAWPTLEIAVRADRSIRNYVWRAEFRMPEKMAPGWIPSGLAEHTPLRGGMGVPNFFTELKALSAMVVGEWAMSTTPQRQQVGRVLQRRDTGHADHLIPQRSRPIQGVRATLWATGRPWAELYFHERSGVEAMEEEEIAATRRVLRQSKGVTTTWTRQGLVIDYQGEARELIHKQKTQRKAKLSRLHMDTVQAIRLDRMWLGNAQGEPCAWKHFGSSLRVTAGMTIGQITAIAEGIDGSIVFEPKTHVIPMPSGATHGFREVCLNIMANFPELVGTKAANNYLQVDHAMEDAHHECHAEDDNGGKIVHTWGPKTQTVPWDIHKQTPAAAVANFLGVEVGSIMIPPHPSLTMMRPLWAGKRRWHQSRRQYKRLMNKKRDRIAVQTRKEIQAKMQADNGELATALGELTWERVYRMEGVSAYLTQNIAKLKLNRLRRWAGQEEGLRCQAETCALGNAGGAAHLVWQCPEARRFWNAYGEGWGYAQVDTLQAAEGLMRDLFTFQLTKMPTWLVKWGANAHIEQ
jgi:hypothetical protein